MGEATWRDVHNKVVTFSGGTLPFQRALMIHARYALKHRRAADFPDDFDPVQHSFDIVSDMDNKAVIHEWLDSLKSLADIPEEGADGALHLRGRRRTGRGKGGKGKGGKRKGGKR
jgi:hypothetical protein